MKKRTPPDPISRRDFLVAGGAAAAAGSLPLAARGAASEKQPRINRHRTLGRTGFQASDISMGGTQVPQANVYRYAYDHGINYFDTGESYGNGESERQLGQAVKYMDRKKIFITTKLHVGSGESEQSIMDRFAKCQERLQSGYLDALYMHSVKNVDLLDHEGFHATVNRLKADGRLRHAGLSSHGPRDTSGDSMEKVLTTAAADGRFDLMLLVYNFMNHEEGDKILAACKEHNVGTTAMKTAPAVVLEPFDPEDPSEYWDRYISRRMKRGASREQAQRMIEDRIAREKDSSVKIGPFMEEYGLSSKQDLQLNAVKWVLSNPDMHTACIGISGFDSIDRIMPLSGTTLARNDLQMVEQHRRALSDRYCRHGCTDCVTACPHATPVSTIMRYAYYFTGQAHEKYAMTKYARLAGRNATRCESCDAPCAGACPHGVDIRANLVRAHDLLTFA